MVSRRSKVNKKKSSWKSTALLSGYCDSNTGPSGPKPDALANCATPRYPSFGTANIRRKNKTAKLFNKILQFLAVFALDYPYIEGIRSILSDFCDHALIVEGHKTIWILRINTKAPCRVWQGALNVWILFWRSGSHWQIRDSDWGSSTLILAGWCRERWSRHA